MSARELPARKGHCSESNKDLSKSGQWWLNLAGNWGHAWKEEETLFPNRSAHWRPLFLIVRGAVCPVPTHPPQVMLGSLKARPSWEEGSPI